MRCYERIKNHSSQADCTTESKRNSHLFISQSFHVGTKLVEFTSQILLQTTTTTNH
jgi:hypothetical protein